jgi:hypothetical protein
MAVLRYTGTDVVSSNKLAPNATGRITSRSLYKAVNAADQTDYSAIITEQYKPIS